MSGNIKERKITAERESLLEEWQLNQCELMGANLSHMAAGGTVLGIVMARKRMFALCRSLRMMVSLAAGMMMGDVLRGIPRM